MELIAVGIWMNAWFSNYIYFTKRTPVKSRWGDLSTYILQVLSQAREPNEYALMLFLEIN